MAKTKRTNDSRRKASKKFPAGESTPAERVVWLLETVWGGNRSAMAQDVGCGHSVLVKIAAGSQGPGRRVLTAIAAHPKVNPAWLLGGEGEPMLAPSPHAPADGWPVPICRRLLPSSPEKNRSLWSGETFPTAGAFYRPTRYWYEVQKSDPIASDPTSKIDMGDLLLMETDSGWRTDHDQVDGKIGAVRIPDDENARVGLGRVIYDPGSADESGYFGVDTFASGVDPKDLVKEIVVREYDDGRLEVTRGLPRHVEERGGKKSSRRVSQTRLGRSTRQIRLEDIIAVCVMMVRR